MFKQNAKPPATQKEHLQQRFNDADRIFLTSQEELIRLDGQVEAEKKALEKLEGEYTAECRKSANGEAADTASLCAERDRRTDRIRGLEVLSKEVQARLAPMLIAREKAACALQDESKRLEREGLNAAIASIGLERQNAQTALRVAEQAEANALWALRQFDRKNDLDMARRQLVVQGRA